MSLLEQTYQSILSFIHKVEATPGATENPALRASLHSIKGRARLLETQLYGNSRSAQVAVKKGLFGQQRSAPASTSHTPDAPSQDTGNTAAHAA